MADRERVVMIDHHGAGSIVDVAIVDNREIERWGLEHLFVIAPRIRLTASVRSGTELDAAVNPDVFVVGAHFESPSVSFEAVAFLAARSHVLVIVDDDRHLDALAALRAGARGLVTASASPDEFVDMVYVLARGGMCVPARWAAYMTGAMHHRPTIGRDLTPREVEALSHVASGLTHAQAADCMGVSLNTFNTHIRRIREKLGVRNKADLTRLAIDFGLAHPSSTRNHRHEGAWWTERATVPSSVSDAPRP